MHERLRHYHHHIRHRYGISAGERLYSIVVAPLIFMMIFFVILRILSNNVGTSPISYTYLFTALGFTFARLFIAYICSLLIALIFLVLMYRSILLEKIFLPLIDVLQSVPVLAFFPIVILFFIHFQFLNGAAIFLIFLSMVWNIVFSIVGGMNVIPNDIKAAANVFHVRGFYFFRRVLFPAVVPSLITGSLLAWAQGWNIIIVAEVLHTYIPGASDNLDLFGIGTILVNAASRGQNQLFMFAIFFMVAAIAFLNFFIWQKLLHYAERFRFE